MPTQSAQRTADIEAWRKSLPPSRLARPSTPRNMLKYAFWKAYAPLHPYVRDALLSLHVVRHDCRQRFLLGKLAPGVSPQALADRLIAQGFGNHFVAWEDAGELVSLRKPDGFSHQYHIRIFDDGEVRGHYEYTTEYSPLMHYKAVRQEPRTEEFRAFLGDMVAPA
ncbi:MAG: hypothetical protein KGI69_03480 [Patescibacteria group bacterium]|nr:hypothetical protein [Patescibacteria group bacterium]